MQPKESASLRRRQISKCRVKFHDGKLQLNSAKKEQMVIPAALLICKIKVGKLTFILTLYSKSYIMLTKVNKKENIYDK